MKRIVDLYFKLLKLLIVLCMIGMLVLVFGNVVLRYAFNSGISVSEELSRWLFVWMIFLGSLVALKERAHMGFDSLVRRLPAGGKRFCLVIGHVLMLYICWLIFSGSWQQAVINLMWLRQRRVCPWRCSMRPGWSSVPVLRSFCCMTCTVLSGKLADDELVMVTDSDAAEDIKHIHTSPSATERTHP